MLGAKTIVGSEYLHTLIEKLLCRQPIRDLLLHYAEKEIWKEYVENNADGRPRQVQLDKFYMIRNMLRAIHRALNNDLVAEPCRRALLNSLVQKTFLGGHDAIEAFKETYGFEPPYFLTVSPGRACNLRCTGCYAGSSASVGGELAFDVLERIVDEKERLWGSYFTVISGGEPFLYESQGKDLIDLAARHPNQYFLAFTNGTPIDGPLADRLAEVGNITPAISVEGMKRETDKRRGRGTFARILEAIGWLRARGVPFGISVTATRDNAELVQSDEFLDFFFKGQGAIYAWLFQYMPIGRHAAMEKMISPEHRVRMYHRTRELVRDDGLFVADFWNSGTVSNGCLSAGRSGGYLYVDWHGNVTPCVFNPYSSQNIVEIYRNGGDLNTVLMSPFFKAIRRWHDNYNLKRPAHKVGNLICQCAVRDHARMMHRMIDRFRCRPIDDDAAQALADPAYWDELHRYGRELSRLTRPIWDEDYLDRERPELSNRTGDWLKQLRQRLFNSAA